MVASPLVASDVTKAVKALLAYRSKQGRGLDLDADFLTVQIGLKQAPITPSPKPRLVALPHPLKDASELSCCLIVKAADKPWLKALAVDGEAPGPKLVDKVLAFDKLRSSYKQYKDKRELRDRFDVFLADDRVAPMLGKLLGSTFFGRKKQPIVVKVTRPESLAAQIRKATASAHVVLKEGTCVAANLAHTDMSADECVANVVAGVNAVVGDLVPKKWNNVLSVSLKLPESAALPLYNADPTAGAGLPDAPPAATAPAKRADTPAAPAKKPAKKDAAAPPPAPKRARDDAKPAAAEKKAKKPKAAPKVVAAAPAAKRAPSLKDKLKARKAMKC
ncbi:hypothetical protein AURANDRAFT_37654 [Aureococcus anophagefferens]|uniref:Ribosomal protein L1 n=1 Tax=Aureococcus anophagefferens TaxID=44056 RepID=F0YAN1_AURAN|nr:hypothetical protein AURANDRAFT_37654 [Aureococcus anophagefferens]EGB07965.1 hypothetical protein AURANDRAFT_37654 [Aureococcus anophagefferens]|eukprot:XP_009037332.1 hypothetical protein AURANDRAFT_37654 [Aureococcus anophagefferens]